jgi:amidase
VVAGTLSRTVADAALLLDAMLLDAPSASGAPHWATAPPTWDGGAYLSAAVRGEGRFSIAVTRDTPWASAYDLDLAPEAEGALTLALAELDALGHGIDDLQLGPEPEYATMFRRVWQGEAAGLELDDAQLAKVEPLTRWLVGEGLALGARDLGAAQEWLAGYERRLIAQFAPFDAILTPALALTPRPIGWYDAENPDHNFEQQVRYTPYTSMVNVSGLPAIVLPVDVTAGGLPMGVQLIGRPGGEHVLFAIGAQLERRLNWARRHPPQW